METSVEVYKKIRSLQLENKDISQRTVAKQLNISRNTVRKYWNGAAVPWERKPYSRNNTVLTDDVKKFIVSCLDQDDKAGTKKQRHTARRIYHRLVDEMGFTGSESAVRRAVHDIRLERYEEAAQAYIPLCFSPGDSMQIDWGVADVQVDGVLCKVNLFCARLCYSCAPFVVAYWSQDQESFLDAIIKSIEYFGGVPKRVVFDNARMAVSTGSGANAKPQEGYTRLAAHYGFDTVFCNAASGNEKGLVEGLVGYIRRNSCVPVPEVNSLDELNELLHEACDNYLEHQINSRPQPVGIMLKDERRSLGALPLHHLDISKKSTPTVGRSSTVIFETNSYSVPCKYRGKSTTLKAFPNTVEVWVDGECVATHERLRGRKQESLQLKHYLPILAKKGRAIRYAKPVVATVPSEFIDWMENQHFSSKEMVEHLEQCVAVGYQAVMQHSVVDTPTPVPDSNSEVTVLEVDLRQYDKRFMAEEVMTV